MYLIPIIPIVIVLVFLGVLGAGVVANYSILNVTWLLSLMVKVAYPLGLGVGGAALSCLALRSRLKSKGSVAILSAIAGTAVGEYIFAGHVGEYDFSRVTAFSPWFYYQHHAVFVSQPWGAYYATYALCFAIPTLAGFILTGYGPQFRKVIAVAFSFFLAMCKMVYGFLCKVFQKANGANPHKEYYLNTLFLVAGLIVWGIGTYGYRQWFWLTSTQGYLDYSKEGSIAFKGEVPKPGDVYEIQASGKIRWSNDPISGEVDWRGTPYPASAARDTSGLALNAGIGALLVGVYIGGVGQALTSATSLVVSTWQPPFIGHERILWSVSDEDIYSHGGTINFAVNDHDKGYEENSGMLEVGYKKIEEVTDAPYRRTHSYEDRFIMNGRWQRFAAYVPPQCHLEINIDAGVEGLKAFNRLAVRVGQGLWEPFVFPESEQGTYMGWDLQVDNSKDGGNLSVMAIPADTTTYATYMPYMTKGASAPSFLLPVIKDTADIESITVPIRIKIKPLDGVEAAFDRYWLWVVAQGVGLFLFLIGLVGSVDVFGARIWWRLKGRPSPSGDTRVEPEDMGGTKTRAHSTSGKDAVVMAGVEKLNQVIDSLEPTHQHLAKAVNQAMQQGFHDVQESSRSWWQSRELKTALTRKAEGFGDLARVQSEVHNYIDQVNTTLDKLGEFYKKTGQTNRMSFLDQQRMKLAEATLGADIAEQEARQAEAERRRREAQKDPPPPPPSPPTLVPPPSPAEQLLLELEEEYRHTKIRGEAYEKAEQRFTEQFGPEKGRELYEEFKRRLFQKGISGEEEF